jgi:hypothetical protein
MPAKRIGAGEAAAAAPVTSVTQVAATDELLLAGMQAFVTFPIVLTSKGFAAHRANERSLISVRTEMRSQIVRPSEALGT